MFLSGAYNMVMDTAQLDIDSPTPLAATLADRISEAIAMPCIIFKTLMKLWQE